jgi:glutamate synthase (NADPH/NADH) small chain
MSDPEVQKQAARCMDCGIPYCHGPTGCPVHNQIPDWNDLVYNNNWEEAIRNLHSTNNFPEFTGRICPAPCEEACTLNLEDAPVAIKTVEQAIADKAYELGFIRRSRPRSKTGKKVAIIGSGPAGMAAAQQLGRAGHEVHVYERESRPAACCATAFRTSRWRRTSSTAASSRWRRGRHLPLRRQCRRRPEGRAADRRA